MSKKQINVYTNMDGVVDNKIINVIVDNSMIKYIDSCNNKFIVDLSKNVLTKENNESIINILFNENLIKVFIKDFNKEFIKEIKTIELINENNRYYVKYKLIDEDIINIYEIKFL